MEDQNSNPIPETANILEVEEEFNPSLSGAEPEVKKKSVLFVFVLVFLLLVVFSVTMYFFLKNQDEDSKEGANHSDKLVFEETERDLSQELVFEEIEETVDIVIDEEFIEITPGEFLKIEEVINPEYDPSITLDVEKTVGSYVLVNKGTVGGLIGETGILKKVDGEWAIKLSFLHNWFERSCDELCQAGVPLELLIDAPGISRSFEFCGDIPYDEYCEINN